MRHEGEEWRVGKQPRAHDVAATRLREWILSGQLAMNEKLPSEFKLTRLMKISRYSVREALARLQHEGLIRKFHGSGSYVRNPVAFSPLEVLPEVVRVSSVSKRYMHELLRFRAAQVALAVGSLLKQGRRIRKVARSVLHEIADLGSQDDARKLMHLEEGFWSMVISSAGNLAMTMSGHQLRRVFQSFHELIPEGGKLPNQKALLTAFARAVRAGDAFKAFAYAQYALKQRNELYLGLLERMPPTHSSVENQTDKPAAALAVAPENEPEPADPDLSDAPADVEFSFPGPAG